MPSSSPLLVGKGMRKFFPALKRSEVVKEGKHYLLLSTLKGHFLLNLYVRVTLVLIRVKETALSFLPHMLRWELPMSRVSISGESLQLCNVYLQYT